MPGSLPDPPTNPDRRRGSWLSVMFTITACSMVFFLLAVLPLGRIGVAVILGSIFFIVIVAFHYFAWGWWVTKVVEREQEDERQGKSPP